MNLRRRQQKKTPAPEGPGSFAGWVRGWGLGGTPPGVRHPTQQARAWFLGTRLFSRRGAAARPAAARTGSLRGVARQFHLTAVGKFEISQVDAKATLGPGTTFNDVACSDREPAGKTINKRTHGTLLGELPRCGSNARSARRFRDKAGDRDGFL